MIRLAAIYFGAVFATGFVLGTLRVLLLVQHVGARNAELLEIPLMLVAIYFVGRWIAYRCTGPRQALAIGFLALVMLLTAEIGLAGILFRKTPLEALLNKDTISGAAYYLALLVFAILPYLEKRGQVSNSQPE